MVAVDDKSYKFFQGILISTVIFTKDSPHSRLSNYF